MPIKTYRQAINEAMAQEMRRDSTVIVIGEDVAGGAGCDGPHSCSLSCLTYSKAKIPLVDSCQVARHGGSDGHCAACHSFSLHAARQKRNVQVS